MSSKGKLEIVMVPTDELTAYNGNAKIHTDAQVEQIASSIEEFDFADPIAAWHDEEGRSVIIEGHGRLMAAQKLGIEELPVIYLDHLTDEQRRAYTIVNASRENPTALASVLGFDPLTPLFKMEPKMDESIQFDMPDAGGVDFDFDLSGFTIDLAPPTIGNERYQKPKAKRTVAAAYENALQLARDIDLHEGFRVFCLVSGNFIFGDLIEAMSQLDKWRVDKITVHTLTMSQDSIDSLENVIIMDQPSQVHIIMSDYWYAHEQGRANGLLWEVYDKLDIGDGFRLAFCRTHAKIVTIQTKAGHKVVMHGSANMRSHCVIEQVTIEADAGLYDFIERFNDGILDEYDIINHGVKRKKPVREKKLFQLARKARP